MSHALVHSELGLQIRAGSALAVADRELREFPRASLEIVCAWCPDTSRRVEAARMQRRAVTHTICRECAAMLTGETFGDE